MDTLSERSPLMSFRRIEYFLSVAKHLNFTKAARECYVAQAAISQQIKQFEEELGFKLFDRGGTAVAAAPPAGEVFCPPMSERSVPVPRGGEAGQVHCRRQEAGPPPGHQRTLHPGEHSRATSGSSGSSTPRRPSTCGRGDGRKSWTPCSRRSWTSSWSLTMTWSWTSGLTCWS